MTEYIKQTKRLLSNLPMAEIKKAKELLQSTQGKIYVCGNGGSFSLACHFVADLNKTGIKALFLPSTTEEITQRANDNGYENVYAGILQTFLEPGDILIAISSSGNSLNIIKAVKLARDNACSVIGLSGFDGGQLNKLAHVRIFIPTQKGEYELVEGVHCIILHLITKWLKSV